MSIATVTPFIEKRQSKLDEPRTISLRVTHQRKRKYYATDLQVKPAYFEKIMNAKRRTEAENKFYNQILSYRKKAADIVEEFKIFTFAKFEELYFNNRGATDSVSFAFDKYIQELKAEDRIGTAVSYECAKASINRFKKNLNFADVTPALLKKYENWMVADGNSITTVGIYLRSLRTLFNRVTIDKSLYPFGKDNQKYSIPTGKNIKKALTVEEIARIYQYEAPAGTTKKMAKDYWVFLYLSNGMNVKDFCLLRWCDIKDNMLEYKRAKTQRSKKENKSISVALKPETWEIIRTWGQPSISKENYIFPHLQVGMSAVRQRAIVQQLTKTINKYIKEIAIEVGINKGVTTYFARHSFATVLKRSGAKIEMISELLGHSSVEVTNSYLDSFEKEQIQKVTDALTTNFGIAK